MSKSVLVVADGHYYRTLDNEVYVDSIYDYSFYKRYLNVFDHVYAVIRAKDVEVAPAGKKKSSGDRITFLFLPNYHGPYQYFQKYLQIRKCVKQFSQFGDCAIFRIPAATSNVFCKYYSKIGRPFAVEVVIDPWENFGPQTAGNPIINYIVRRNWTKLVKDMCQKANGASYVTAEYLQKHYPPRAYIENNSKYFTASYSSVELPDDSFAQPRKWSPSQKTFIIVHVSNYFSGYGKGHLVLMQSLKQIIEKGYDVKIKFIGDGPKRKEFEDYAKRLKISEYVTFVGKLPNGNEVRKVISSADLFVLPTLAEGLPRALLEAMAEGLPCLSSPVCGIPEVLESKFLYDFDDIEGWTRGIINFITNIDKMGVESKKNIQISKKYASSILNQKRNGFYEKLYNLA